MKLDNLLIVISYCSLHNNFIEQNIKECLKVTKNIYITYHSYLYDGTLENIEFLNKLREKYSSIKILNFKINLTDDHYKNFREISKNSRVIAYKQALVKIDNLEWIFFIDADEIPEGDRLKTLLLSIENHETDYYKNYLFATYWYYKQPIYQATSIEQNPLLLHINNFDEKYLCSDYERSAYMDINKSKDSVYYYTDDMMKPIFHHFSWVVKKENLEKSCKLRLKNINVSDEKIKQILEEEISDATKLTDPIHNYTYLQVDNIFNITL